MILLRIAFNQQSILQILSESLSSFQICQNELLSWPILSFFDANSNLALDFISFGSDSANLLSNVTMIESATYVLIINGKDDS